MSLFLSGGARPQAVCSPDTPQPYIYNKVKTTNANIKRYKEQVMTRDKKKDDDRPEKYGGDNTTTARTADTLTAADENS